MINIIITRMCFSKKKPLYINLYSILGEESTVEFPEGEVPPDAVNLASSSSKENDEKSKSPVRFIKSSDGTIKISSVTNSSARYPTQSDMHCILINSLKNHMNKRQIFFNLFSGIFNLNWKERSQ